MPARAPQFGGEFSMAPRNSFRGAPFASLVWVPFASPRFCSLGRGLRMRRGRWQSAAVRGWRRRQSIADDALRLL